MLFESAEALGVSATRECRFDRECFFPVSKFFNPAEHQPAGGNGLGIGIERRQTGRDQIGVDEFTAAGELIQVRHREGRFAGTVRAGDDVDGWFGGNVF